ncbi:hypothetical protein F2P81_008998 [Scophthalmus maximus]|uniref:Uncharacterized protein n=1 Tax=Scophthalmus maximus TaxID=52904 RepID=A0A6A4T5P0_SCOMX|nr:hypothetical protein F2P81_008998 [Scophthalmus maximus]
MKMSGQRLREHTTSNLSSAVNSRDRMTNNHYRLAHCRELTLCLGRKSHLKIARFDNGGDLIIESQVAVKYHTKTLRGRSTEGQNNEDLYKGVGKRVQ